MILQINLSHKLYLFINMITHIIFINIKNYHKKYFIKINSLKLRFIFRYDKIMYISE